MFEGFFLDKMFSDFTIIVNNNGTRVELPAHRIVIASWTLPLKQMVLHKRYLHHLSVSAANINILI
jgi:hypothetical protein